MAQNPVPKKYRFYTPVSGSASLFLALATLARRESFVTSPPVISRSTPVVESVQVRYKLFQIKFSPTYEVDTRDNHDWVDGRELSAGVASSIYLKV